MIEIRHNQVTISGASIHTITAGPPGAPGLLLLHGWPESWATWRELIPLAAPDHQVIAIDLPGIGGSGRGTVPGSKSGIAQLVHGLADALRRAGLTDVRPAVISGAGHFPHEEAAAATWRAISGFISDTPLAPDSQQETP